MIEVEIRGQLTKTESEALKSDLARDGKHVRSQDREVVLFRDGYAGYHPDMGQRDMDIRVRITNGRAEIVVKRGTGNGNVGRHELIIPVTVDSLDPLVELGKSFGVTKGLWMRRVAEVYETPDGIEWAVVEAPHRSGTPIKYLYEAELVVESKDEIPAAQNQLESAAKARNLPVLKGDDHYSFIQELGATVNEHLDLTQETSHV